MKLLSLDQQTLAKTVMNNSYTLWGKKLASIPIEIMDVDLSYQRYVTSTIKKLNKNWNDDECRFLLVSYRDGLFYILDGQHRFKVAKSMGKTELPCEIYTGLSKEEEALIFARQNDNVSKLTPYDTYKAKVASGMSDLEDVKLDLLIKSVCDKHGITVMKASQNKNLRAVSKARSLVQSHGAEVLDWIFNVAEKLKWTESKDTYCATIITLLGNIYIEHKENLAEVEKKFVSYVLKNEYTPRHLFTIANERYPDQIHTYALRYTVERILIDN